MPASALYEGRVRHRRLTPTAHAFSYRLLLCYLDLDEIPQLFDDHLLWSARGPAPAWFRRDDHFGDPDQTLRESLVALTDERIGWRPDGAIRVLTHPRYFGYCFNPVSFFYLYPAGGSTPRAIVAEVDNTPWGERHCYVLDCARAEATNGQLRFRFPKAFHVSPFMPMEMHYEWSFTVPGEHLFVHMDSLQGGAKQFDATMTLARRPIDRRGLRAALWRYPLLSLQVVGAIYWQAFRLWLKGTPFHPHPKHLAGSPERTAPELHGAST